MQNERIDANRVLEYWEIAIDYTIVRQLGTGDKINIMQLYLHGA
jgi:hypothetical protein